jgi:hypothetical protein
LIFVQVHDSNETIPEQETPIVYPGSNDTSLLLLRPTLVNLGSQSSKCTEVKTPQDPEKISLIDNKRMSIIIGVVGGLVVFAGIIVIIVSKPNSKDDDEPIDESLAIGGANCPKESNLIFTGAAISSRYLVLYISVISISLKYHEFFPEDLQPETTLDQISPKNLPHRLSRFPGQTLLLHKKSQLWGPTPN